MPLSRRSFFGTACVAACGAALSQGPSLGAAAFTSKLSQPLAYDPAEPALVAFLGQYSADVRLVGSGVLAKLRHLPPAALHYVVRVADLSLLAQALANALPGAAISSSGNLLAFTSGGIDFSITNLLPADFTEHVAGLLKPKSLAFAHDGLSYEPGALKVSDPFAAAERKNLKLVNPTLSGAEAVAAILRGTAEASALGLGLSPEFNAWRHRILNVGARSANASVIASAFLLRVANLPSSAPASAVLPALLSRLVSTALLQTYGTNATTVAARFEELRPTLDGSVSNAALWLALLLGLALGPDATPGLADGWTQGGTPQQNSRSVAALMAARIVLTLPAFQSA